MNKLSMLTFAAVLCSEPAAAWLSGSEKSPVDDRPIYSITQHASAILKSKSGGQWQPSLQLVCENNTTILAFLLPDLYMSSNGTWGEVVMRIDDKPAKTVRMRASNDHKSMALVGAPAVRIAKEMINGEKLFARFLPVNDSVFDVNIDIKGMAAAAAPLRQACGW